MHTYIFYYSGTGNSLFAAKKLSDNIAESTVIPIISAAERDIKLKAGDAIGFVFPVYAFSLPEVVEKFLHNIQLRADAYVFAVATRGGSSCKVFEHLEKILKKKGNRLHSRFFLNMPNNYLTMFPIPVEDEVEELTQKAVIELKKLAKIIMKRQKYEEIDPHYSFGEKHILFPVLTHMLKGTNYFNMEKKFYSDDKCNGCTLCSKICLSGKIGMKDGRPGWDSDTACYHCFACIHFCPSQAIQLKGTKTNTKQRYHHPTVTASDILYQKHSAL